MAVNIRGSILKNVIVSSSIAGNPYYPYVVLQLNCLGAVNSQVFLDTSSDPKLVLTNGDTEISDALGIQTGSYNGTTDYLVTNGADLNMNSSDYQFQSWVYLDVPDDDTNRHAILSSYNGVQSTGRWVAWIDTNKTFVFSEQDGNGVNTTNIISPGTLPLRQRVHVAVSKQGTTMRMFINGILVATNTAMARTEFTNHLQVGAFEPSVPVNAWYWKGYIGPLELYKGIATYTADFTPLPGPFPDFV